MSFSSFLTGSDVPNNPIVDDVNVVVVVVVVDVVVEKK